jgi:hypothetical protein
MAERREGDNQQHTTHKTIIYNCSALQSSLLDFKNLFIGNNLVSN